jgi:hypothetical protein
MFGGITDGQISSFIDTAASMDPITLRRILKVRVRVRVRVRVSVS